MVNEIQPGQSRGGRSTAAAACSSANGLYSHRRTHAIRRAGVGRRVLPGAGFLLACQCSARRDAAARSQAATDRPASTSRAASAERLVPARHASHGRSGGGVIERGFLALVRPALIGCLNFDAIREFPGEHLYVGLFLHQWSELPSDVGCPASAHLNFRSC